jgi:hypothetical protein
MINATYNNELIINKNLADNLTIPIVKLDNNLEIPTIPFIWHREECLMIPIQSIIKINLDTMKHIIDKFIDDPIKDKIKSTLQEAYIVSQYTVLSDVFYYISYHGLMYRQYIKDEHCVVIPKKYDETEKFNSIMYSINKVLNPDKKLIESTGHVIIHGQAFSPTGCFKFKIDESMDKYIFLVHGQSLKTKQSATVLFIMINDHNKIKKSIKVKDTDTEKIYANKMVVSIIDDIIKTNNDKFLDTLKELKILPELIQL